jgi:hypothetical protein
MISRAGQTESKTCDFAADCPERESTDHDAAPAAIARTDSATGEPGGGHGSDRTDKAATRPVMGTGDICERLRREIVWEPEVGELLAEAADEIERLRLTDAEREAVRRAIDTLGGIEDLLADAGIKDDAALRSLRGLLDRF